MKTNPYIYLLRQYRKYANKKYMIIVIFSFFIISNIVTTLGPYFVGELINTLQTGGPDVIRNTIIILVILGLIPLVQRIFHGNARVREEKLKFQVNKSFQEDIFHATTSLPLSRHNDNHSGQTIDQFNKASFALREFTGGNFMYIGTVMTFVSSIAALVWIRPLGGSIICLVGLTTFVVVRKFDQAIIPLQKTQNTKWHKVASILFDYLSNIKTIITLRCESIVKTVLSDSIEQVRPSYNKYIVINERKWFIVSMILAAVTSITIGFYIYGQVTTGATILIGTIAMMYQYIQRLSESFYSFAWQYSSIVSQRNDFQTVEHIITTYDSMIEKDSTESLKNRKHITIDDLSFGYSGKRKILNHMSLDIMNGQKIALIGASGNGKSTLLSLIRGLYETDNISLHIDQKEYRSLSILHHITSLIPQDPEIFEHSIRYNITMGTDVSDREIQPYIDIADFDSVIKELPHGLDSDIKEKGVNLSGGQKQRLALARGLFLGQKSDILLLDEATSSVDALGEKHIYESLFAHFNKKTIIASVHRLHMLDMFDMIYLIDKGRVIESGNLEQILALDGMTKHMRDNYMRQHVA